MVSEKNRNIMNNTSPGRHAESAECPVVLDHVSKNISEASIVEQLSLVKNPSSLFSDSFTKSLSPELQVYISEGKKYTRELDEDSLKACEESVNRVLEKRGPKVNGVALYVSTLGVMRKRKCSAENALDILLGSKPDKEIGKAYALEQSGEKEFFPEKSSTDQGQDAKKRVPEPDYEDYKKFRNEKYNIRSEAIGNFFKDLVFHLVDYFNNLKPEEIIKLKSINSAYSDNIDKTLAILTKVAMKKTGKDVLISNMDATLLNIMFHVFRHDEAHGKELYQKTKRILNSIGAVINDQVDYKHFDPEYDEVIQEETSKYPPGTVIEVFSPGLKIRKDDDSFRNHKSRQVKLSKGSK